MKTLLAQALLAGCAAAWACGGSRDASGGATSPVASAAPASLTSDSGGEGPAAAAASTTTVAPGEGGDLQGTKLTETHAVASASASAAAPPKGVHTHDPGRGPQDIRAIIVGHRDEARACYDRGLKDHPGIEGDLVVQWTIDPKGAVTDASLDMSRSTLVEPTVVSCIEDVVKRVQFAPSAGGFETKAFYPFNFHPRRDQPRKGP